MLCYYENIPMNYSPVLRIKTAYEQAKKTYSGPHSRRKGKMYMDKKIISKYDLNFTPYLLEPWELVEEHAQHHLVCFGRQVRQEENLVGRGVVHAALGGACRHAGANWSCASLLKIFSLKLNKKRSFKSFKKGCFFKFEEWNLGRK